FAKILEPVAEPFRDNPDPGPASPDRLHLRSADYARQWQRPCRRMKNRQISFTARVPDVHELDTSWTPIGSSGLSYCFYWRSLGDSNPCFRRERATSWAARRREQ